MSWEDELERCELAAGPFPPSARRCDWCGTSLEGRRRRWCSDDCSNGYSRNHAWTSARAAALARDGVCQRCGSDGTPVVEGWYRFLQVVCPWPILPKFETWCRDHGWFDDHLEARIAFRNWQVNIYRSWRLADQLLDVARKAHRLEVNHKTPCLGAHRLNSCLHHLDGLEVLCRPCHRVETNRQRRAGLLAS